MMLAFLGERLLCKGPRIYMSEQQYIQSIRVSGLHETETYGGANFDVEFAPGVNVMYGLNGSGKTTLMHIMANILNLDFQKFVYLDFGEVAVRFTDGTRTQYVDIWTDSVGAKKCRMPHSDREIMIASGEDAARMKQERTNPSPDLSADPRVSTRSRSAALRSYERALFQNEFLRRRGQHLTPAGTEILSHLHDESLQTTLPNVSYFPAFRNVSEIINLIEQNALYVDSRSEASAFAQEIYGRAFGAFAPKFEYPSFLEIEFDLKEKVDGIVADVARQNREVLSEISYKALKASLPNISEATTSLRSVVSDLQETPIYAWLPEVASTFNELLEEVTSDETEMSEIAHLYSDALSEIVKEQRDKYEDIRLFKDDAVNRFLINKELVIQPGEGPRHQTEVGIRRDGTDELIELSTMSSGERQVFSLLYAASFLGENEIVLIDEPEISLHIDWQTQLPKAMSNILGKKQLVVCTHSPEIFSGFRKVKGAHTIELDPAPVEQYI